MMASMEKSVDGLFANEPDLLELLVLLVLLELLLTRGVPPEDLDSVDIDELL